jgi:hypothetical protein
MNTEEQIEKLGRAADWRATLIILTGAFAGDQRVWQHVDLDRERIHFRTILDDGTFSSGERTLLKVAASLFNQEHSVNLWEIFNRLDDTNAALVLKAIESFCRS